MRNNFKIKGIMIYILCIMAFLFAFELIIFTMVKTSRERIMGSKNRLTARSLAMAGIHYSEKMIKSGKWKPNAISPSPGTISGDLLKFRGLVCLKESFDSPVLANPGGFFHVSIYSYEENFYRIISTGKIGKQSFEMSREFPEYFPPGEERIPGSYTEPVEQTEPLDIERVEEEIIEITPFPSESPFTPDSPLPETTKLPEIREHIENPPLPEVY